MSHLVIITLLISDVLKKSLPPVLTMSNMLVKSRFTDMSKWVSNIRRTCHVLFLEELEGCRYVLFCWCHNPPRKPKTLSAGRGLDLNFFFFGFESTQLGNRVQPTRTQMEVSNDRCPPGYPAHELGHRTPGPKKYCMVPGIPWCGHTSERTGNPGNQESGLGEGTGTRPDYLVNRDNKKWRGNSGKTIALKSRNSCRLNSRSCGSIGRVDSGPKCANS